MNLQDFKDIHRDKSAVEKLNLLIDAMDMMAVCRVSYATTQSLESKVHCQSEYEGQRQRAEWLYEEIKTALTAQNTDSGEKNNAASQIQEPEKCEIP